MDELRDSFAEAIGDFFSNYFSSLDDVVKLAKACPSDNITGFPSVELWNASKGMSTSIAVGVGSTIVALFLFFELASIFNRSDNKGWDGIYWILMAFLKMAFAVYLCKNMTVIIQAIFEIQALLVKNISASNFSKELSVQSVEISEQLTEYYKDVGLGGVMVGWFIGLIAQTVNNIAMVIVSLICKIRFIEIYVFTAVAPLPFATFTHRDYKSIGIAFLKRLMALALQGVFIVIVCYFYVTIANATIGDVTVDGSAIKPMFEMMGYSLLLLIAVFQTGGWAKSLLQVS